MVANEDRIAIRATHHIAIVTAHFTRLQQFYRETLGLKVLGSFPEQQILFLDAGTTAIELIGESAAGAPTGTGGWAHLALEVADVDAAATALAARGVPFQSLPEDFPQDAPAMRIAFCTDPDGNVLELLQPLGSRYPALARERP